MVEAEDPVPVITRKHFEEALACARKSVTAYVTYLSFNNEYRIWTNLSNSGRSMTQPMQPELVVQLQFRSIGQ